MTIKEFADAVADGLRDQAEVMASLTGGKLSADQIYVFVGILVGQAAAMYGASLGLYSKEHEEAIGEIRRDITNEMMSRLMLLAGYGAFIKQGGASA